MAWYYIFIIASFGVVVLDDMLHLMFKTIDILPNFSLVIFLLDLVLLLLSFAFWIFFLLLRLLHGDIITPLQYLFRLFFCLIFSIFKNISGMIIDLITYPFQLLSDIVKAVAPPNMFPMSFKPFGQLVMFDPFTMSIYLGLNFDIFQIVGLKGTIGFSLLGSEPFTEFGYNFGRIGLIGIEATFLRILAGTEETIFLPIVMSLEGTVLDLFEQMIQQSGTASILFYDLMRQVGFDELLAQLIAGLSSHIHQFNFRNLKGVIMHESVNLV